MIILDITVLAPGTEVGKKLGNPQSWTEASASAASVPAPSPINPAPKANLTSNTLPKPTATTSLNTSQLGSQMTHPIASLSPYQNK